MYPGEEKFYERLENARKSPSAKNRPASAVSSAKRRVSRVYAGESFCRDASRRVSQTHAQERHAAGAAVRGRLVARVPLAARQLRSGAGVAAENNTARRLLERRRRLRSGDAPRRGS
jgi:hypothetical protein